MNTTPPTELETALARTGLSDLLETYIAPERVRRWGFLSVERFAASQGYSFVREHGNIYGKLRLVPTPPVAPRPVMRVVTRSDHAAVYGSRRAA